MYRQDTGGGGQQPSEEPTASEVKMPVLLDDQTNRWIDYSSRQATSSEQCLCSAYKIYVQSGWQVLPVFNQVQLDSAQEGFEVEEFGER